MVECTNSYQISALYYINELPHSINQQCRFHVFPSKLPLQKPVPLPLTLLKTTNGGDSKTLPPVVKKVNKKVIMIL